MMSTRDYTFGEASAFRVRLDKEQVARIELYRPGKANALRRVDKVQLAESLEALGTDDRVRVIVISSSYEGVFCAGTDIQEMSSMSVDDALQMFKVEAQLFAAVLECPKPVIAIVDGVALGAGCILAYCADICVASIQARFGQPEVRNGVPAPAQVSALPYIVGWNRARSLLLAGKELTGEEAENWGLIHLSAPSSQLADMASDTIDHVLGLPPYAYMIQKRIMYDSLRFGFAATVGSSMAHSATAFGTDEPQRSIRTFLESRRSQRKAR